MKTEKLTMKIIAQFLLLFALFSSFFQPAKAQNCPLKVQFSVIDATCFNNGKVCYCILDGADNPITDLSGTGLSSIRVYYREREEDSARYAGNYYYGGVDTLMLDYGKYFFGMEALCDDGMGGYVKVDTQAVLTIHTSYTVPTISAIYTTAQTEDEFGLHPSLSCFPTGRVQLIINNGRLPYNLTVVSHSDPSDTLRTVVFDAPQYSGTDPFRYDFKDYYTFDDLPGGVWDFSLIDGCGYGLPQIQQTVEVVSVPLLDSIGVFASSGNPLDSNVVKINALINPYLNYYVQPLHPYMQYRFSYDGHPIGDWKPFPPTSSAKTILYDTITEFYRYCDSYGKEMRLDYHFSLPGCIDTMVSRAWSYHLPDAASFRTSHTERTDSVVSADECDRSVHTHTDEHTIRYSSYQPSYVNNAEDHAVYRYHYTHPLTWIYIDPLTDNIIKKDTVAKIDDASRLKLSDMTAYYSEQPPFSHSVERKLVDGHGCVLFDRTDVLTYDVNVSTTQPSWNFHADGNDHCCSVLRTIRVNESNSTGANADGTVVRLVESPYNNRYNFVATYDATSQDWQVVKSHFGNTLIVVGDPSGHALTIQDYCLPSGPYQFEIITPCDSFNLRRNVSFADVYSVELSEMPEYTVEQACTDQLITYTQGAFARVSHNTSPSTGLDIAPVSTVLNPRFQVVEGPVGGYDIREYHLGEPIRIAVPGVYVVRIFPENESSLCEPTELFDTIQYAGGTVQFEYLAAYLCDSNSTIGSVYVKGTNGTLPYTYSLFSEADRQGTLLGTNSDGRFPSVPMVSGHSYSCLITDACGAFFHVNFYPYTLADLQKTWFDGGLRVTTTCEGSTVQVHALQVANIFNYEWVGPDGFHSTSSDPNIFIAHGASDGWYKVDIMQTGCQDHIFDSIYLSVTRAPWVTTSGGGTFCAGSDVEVTFTPDNEAHSGEIQMVMTFENGTGVETRTYSGEAGVPITDTYSTTTPAKIYPSHIAESGGCDYASADPGDTVYVNVLTNMVEGCQLLTRYDTVCYEYDAQLWARSTVEPPYTLNWYADYNLTQLLKSEVITDAGWSVIDTSEIRQRTILYTSVIKEGYCPRINGLANMTMNLSDGTTVVGCNEVYHVYDSGGELGNFAPREDIFHTFTSTDGKPITILFEELNLSTTSHLYVFSGHDLDPDSMLNVFSVHSAIPDLITSNGNELSLYFTSGMSAGAGWSAIVQHEPGIAIADVYEKNHVTLYDEVCQSHSLPYDDLYHITPDVVSQSELDEAVKKAGTYIFNHNFVGAAANGCDSVVTFILTVNSPPHHDTTVVTSNFELNGNPYIWKGHAYDTTGRYSEIIHTANGCDSLDIINLIILIIDTTDNEICRGETTTMGVMVTTPKLTWQENEIPAVMAPGDVLCSDGSVIRVDSFLRSDKVPIGVVYYVDYTGQHGKAVALVDAPTTVKWARKGTSTNPSDFVYRSIHGKQRLQNQRDALFDLDGIGNTLAIKQYAEMAEGEDFAENAPAAYFCFYYDPVIQNVEPSEARGWYLPAMGELNLVFGNRAQVNKSLSRLGAYGATTLSTLTYYYLSSSEKDDNGCWHLDYSGHFMSNTKDALHHVRPSIDF